MKLLNVKVFDKSFAEVKKIVSSPTSKLIFTSQKKT